jgi:hypothetical protein
MFCICIDFIYIAVLIEKLDVFFLLKINTYFIIVKNDIVMIKAPAPGFEPG